MTLSKEQRRKHLREKYYARTEKLFALLFAAVMFLVILYGIYYSIVLGWDPFITVVLAVAFLVLIPVMVILIDAVFYEGI